MSMTNEKQIIEIWRTTDGDLALSSPKGDHLERANPSARIVKLLVVFYDVTWAQARAARDALQVLFPAETTVAQRTKELLRRATEFLGGAESEIAIRDEEDFRREVEEHLKLLESTGENL